MIDEEQRLQHATAFVAFATVGALNTTQELVHDVLGSIDGADRELVAEETLCLVATTTARAAEAGLREAPALAATVTPPLLALPLTYRDYLLGSAMLEREDPALAEAGEAVYQRLGRKQDFYAVHFLPGHFPGVHALTDKMALWMGRVSPPKLPELPQERLETLGLVPRLLTHLKLVLASARRHSNVAEKL